MSTPTWGPPPQATPQTPGMSARKKGCLGCGGAALGVLVLMVILGLIVGPQKKGPTASAAPASGPSTLNAPSPTATHTTAPAPSKTAAAPKPHQLAHGAQSGFENCVIAYKDAQMGARSVTFTAYVLGDNGQAYPTADSANYSVKFSMTVTDTSGGQHAVSENFGSGSRTAADNPGGSDWFTVNQGDVQVSADNAHGVLTATVQEPLAHVMSVSGNLTLMGNNDNSVATKDCAVRRGQG